MTAVERGKPRSRLALVTGIILAFLSIAAIVLSLGAPGLGWAFASMILLAASVCARWIGLRLVSLCMTVTVIHFVTVGPLSDSGGANVGWGVVIFFWWGPLIVSGLVLLMSLLRARIARTTQCLRNEKI